MTFGSFLLLLTVITATGMASVIAIRHIDSTFVELRRLQDVGDVAEQIDRRVNELRLAARDFVTDPNAQPDRVVGVASELGALLKKTRLELAPEQQDMIDGVTQRLANYRDGIERVTALIARRAELLAALPPVRARFEQAVTAAADQSGAKTLLRAQDDIAVALLANDPGGAEQAAMRMRALTIDDPALRGAADAFADAITAIAGTESEIAKLDKEVLGIEGRLIGRVTELLRELSARRGRVLSGDFARTLTEAKWQSIILSTIGVLIGTFAASFVVRRTVGPLTSIASAIRALAAGKKDTSIPATEVNNEIGDIARAAEVFRRTLVDADAAREAAVRALAEQRLAEESYRKLFETSIDGIYVTTPGGKLLNANPALARIMRYDTPEQLIESINDIAQNVYVNPAAREEFQRLMQRDGMVREFEYQVRQRGGGILWLSDSATAVRDEKGEVTRYEGTVRDITDQKRAEDAIAEGRRLLQQVIDTVPAVINVKDNQLRYVLMNRYMSGIFGIEPEDAIGRTTTELMSRYGAQKTDEFDKRVLEGGMQLGFYEDEYVDSKGQMRQWLVNKLPLLDTDGKVDKIVSVALDIGERKRSELEMRKARDAAETALRNLRDTQPGGRTDPVVQTGRRRPQLFGSANLRSCRSHRTGGPQSAAWLAQAQPDAQRRVPAQSRYDQLSRPIRAGADQSVPQRGGACLSGRPVRRRRHQGAGVRQRQCRDHLLRQRLRHVARRAAPRVRSFFHNAQGSGRHRARSAHRLQHRHQPSRRPARSRFGAGRRHANSDYPAARRAARASRGVAPLASRCRQACAAWHQRSGWPCRPARFRSSRRACR